MHFPFQGCVGAHMQFRYVLSNRFLFKLVEQPPADMAALFHAFSSTPPVVKRRAKELLDVIRNAVKKGLSGASEESRESPHAEAAVGSNKMDVDVPLASTIPVPEPTSLWPRNKALPTAATSSLFGATMLASRPQPVYSTPCSSLFGSLPCPGVPKVDSSSRFQDVVNKIHGTLVIAPTIPTVREPYRILFMIPFLMIALALSHGAHCHPRRNRCRFYHGCHRRWDNSRYSIRSGASQADCQGRNR